MSGRVFKLKKVRQLSFIYIRYIIIYDIKIFFLTSLIYICTEYSPWAIFFVKLVGAKQRLYNIFDYLLSKWN